MKAIRRTLPVATAAILLAAGSLVGSIPVQAETTNASPAASKSTATTTPTNVSGTQAETPAELLRLLGERIKAKDLDGIVALHAPRATIVKHDESIVRGHKEIRAFYAEWFKSDPVLKVDPQQIMKGGGYRLPDGKVYGRLATVMGSYTLTQTGPDGNRVTFTGDFCDVVRELPDGTWTYVFDNPYPPHN